MSKVKVTLAVGFALTLVVCAFVLTRSPPRVVRVNQPPPNANMAVTDKNPAFCQTNEVLPAGVSAIRLAIAAFFGSHVHLIAYRGTQVLTEGSRGPDWTGTTVTVPVKPLARTTSGVAICFALNPNSELVIVPGRLTAAREAAVSLQGSTLAPPRAADEALRLSGRISIEYLSSGHGSWWSRILPVARRLGLGHVLSGTWLALLVAALVAAVGLLAVRLTLREIP